MDFESEWGSVLTTLGPSVDGLRMKRNPRNALPSILSRRAYEIASVTALHSPPIILDPLTRYKLKVHFRVEQRSIIEIYHLKYSV